MSAPKRTSKVSVVTKSSHFSSKKSTVISQEPVFNTIITVPPDGGWGWVIVIAAFFCNFIVDGVMCSFGIFLKDIAKTFNVYPTTIGIASSILTGFYFGFGAITCALVNRFGFRKIGFLGGLFSSAAFIISSQATNAIFFLVVLGILGGTGFGMIYVPSIIAVGFYFERWRSLATSISLTGTSLGIVCLPIILKNMSAYSWKTKFLIIGGSFLAVSFIVLVYRPLEPVHVLKSGNQILQFIAVDDSIISPNPDQSPGIFSKLFRYHNKQYPTAAEMTIDNITGDFDVENANYSFSSISTTSSMEGLTFVKTDQIDAHKSFATSYEHEKNVGKGPCSKLCGLRCCKWCGFKGNVNRPMYRDDILYGGSLNILPQYARLVGPPSSIFSRTSRGTRNTPISMEYHMSVSRVATQRDLENKGGKCCPEAITRTLATMLDVSLLKSPSFFLLSLSGGLTFLGVYVPFIYTLERAHEFGISESSSTYLLSALGAGGGFGRIFSGILSSIPGANPTPVSYINILISGLFTIISCFMNTVLSQYIYVVIYGITISCVTALRPPIVVDLMGIEKLTNAFGIILMFEGIAGFIGLPIAGQLMQLTKTYNACFYFAGTSITLSGIILIPIKQIAVWEKRKK